MKYKILFELLLLLFISQTVVAQSEKNDLVTLVGEAISNAKQESVAVLGFVPADPKLEAVSTNLADDFSLGLKRPNFNLQVVERDQIKKTLAEQHIRVTNLLDPGIASWLAKAMGAKAMVLGKLTSDPSGTLSLSVSAYRVENGKALTSFKASIPLAEDMKELVRADTADNSTQPAVIKRDCATVAPQPCKRGQDGYSPPKCKVCPNPKYTPEGISQHLEGRVELMVTVDESGRVVEVEPVKALPYGLTLSAIQMVQTWTLYPAMGPDGKPLAVKQQIEVSFDFGR